MSNFSNILRSCAGRLRPHLPQLFLLLAATLAVYARALGHDFLVNWDDPEYVTANEMIRGVSSAHLKEAFSTFYFSNYAPLQLLSYMLDYELWKLQPAGYILTNILLHAFNGIFFYFLLVRVRGARMPAFLAALIFLLHPVQVESVAWVSERKNLLAMAFFLVALLGHVAYREKGATGGGSRYALSLAAFLGALLSKSVAVVLPPFLVLYDQCHGEKVRLRRRVLEIFPYLLLAGFFAFMAMRSHSPDFAGGGRTGFHGGGPLATFFTMLPVMVDYLGMILWPTHLSAVYDPPIKTGVDVPVALAALILSGCCIFGTYLYRRRKELFLWYAVYFLALVPVAQIVPLTTLMNDRYLYFPMLGASAFIVFAGADLLGGLAGRGQRFAVVIVPVILLALAVSSQRRVDVWKDAVTVWSDAVAKVPGSATAAYALGGAYTQSGGLKSVDDCVALGRAFERASLPEKALPAYYRALYFDPLNQKALYNIGRICLKNGDFPQAASHLQRLVTAHPRFAEGVAAMGDYYLLTGQLAAAQDTLHQALLLDPRSVTTLRLLGDLDFRIFRLSEARNRYLQALAIDPDDRDTHYQLSTLEAVRGRTEESLRQLKYALRLGYADRRSLGLNPLRESPDFKRLIARYLKE